MNLIKKMIASSSLQLSQEDETIPVRLEEPTSAAEDYQQGLKGDEQWVSEVLDFSSSYRYVVRERRF